MSNKLYQKENMYMYGYAYMQNFELKVLLQVQRSPIKQHLDLLVTHSGLNLYHTTSEKHTVWQLPALRH
jgi:hypothetical protein